MGPPPWVTCLTYAYTLKRCSKWPLFNFFFIYLALMLFNRIFAQICAYQWIKDRWCSERVFYHSTFLGFKIAKIIFLKTIRLLSAFFSN